MPECGLHVYDAEGQVLREARVQVPDVLDQPALDRLHRQAILGVPALYATLSFAGRIRALFLHAQVVPDDAVITASRRRSPGRWVTGAVSLPDSSAGRGVLGPEMFFRQVDLDPSRAWMSPLLLLLAQRPTTRVVRLHSQHDDEQPPELWSWEIRGERFYYRERGTRWRLYGAGNTPMLRLEQAVHLADPKDFDAYLWAVGAVPLGRLGRGRPRAW